MTINFIITTILLSILSLGCQEDEKGSSIGAPQVEPPVTNNMPTGITAASLLLSGGDSLSPIPTMAEAVKSYLYPANEGPSPITRLAKIDERMGSLNARAEDSPRACMENGTTEWSLPADLPTGETFPLYFQCQETLSATSSLAFGLKDGWFYLIEQTGSTDDEAIVVLVKAKQDGSEVDTWTVAYQKDGGHGAGERLNYMHISARDGEGIEVTTAGSGTGYVLACGIHLHSDDSNVYVTGQIAYGEACQEAATYCYSATDMADAGADTCTGASLDSFALTTVTQQMTIDTMSSIAPLLNTKVSGYTEFNEDK